MNKTANSHLNRRRVLFLLASADDACPPVSANTSTSAFTFAGTLIIGIVWALVNVNIRHWAGAKGHDVYLLKLGNSLPEWGRKLLVGWSPLRQRWWLWLSLGLSGGLGIALWLLAAAEPATPAPDIEKITAPIRAELEATKRQLQVAASVPTSLSAKHLGPLTTLQIVQSLAYTFRGAPAAPAPPWFNPIELHWALVITAPKENTDIATVIEKLITTRLEAFRLETSDRSINLDAPVFPEPGDAGITLHGINVLNQRPLEALAQCFIVRKNESHHRGA